MEVKSVGVVGTGQVGTTIAQVFLMYGLNLVMEDTSQGIIERARATIDGSLERRVARGELDAAKKAATINRLKMTTNLADLKGVDLVVEAAGENLELKKGIFAELDRVCSPKTILATNSSSIPVTSIAAATKRPDRCVKIHFWYPATVITYMEISRGYLTSDATWETTKKLAKQLGRDPIRIVKDYAGGTNSYLREKPPTGGGGGGVPFWDLMLGKTTLEEIEAQPKGQTVEGRPQVLNSMESMDFIGLDTMFGIAEVRFRDYGTGWPAPLHRRMVEAGHLGQKTGIGFYDYSKSPRKAIPGKFSPYLVKFLAKDEEFVT
ncbi:MAG: 3-hydroxybutyryl-CoA dehydrogenase [Chloroflexi bacterium]|nr:3-hydroxybutyryl-CoA dehydrogenase [Chloroflexota bacterium]MBI3931209.1 3-hydroxybutyryl-CoA dehydrogenase [Chloroflexota bacterium]